MCFNNAMSAKAIKLAQRYGRNIDIIEAWEQIIEERKLTNPKVVNYTQEVYQIPAYYEPECSIITHDEQIQVMQWGLIPEHAKMEDRIKYKKGNWFKNAQAEKTFDTWPYRMYIGRQRCIIPSTGYYEPHHNDDETVTYYRVLLKDEEIFSIAGLWDIWENPETKEQIKSFVMFTTEANELSRWVHNGGKHPFRMPLVLHRDDEEKWLDPELTDKQIESLLKVYPDKNMEAYPVRSDFQKVKPTDKVIIEKKD